MPSTWADSGIGFSKAQLNRVDDFRAWLRKSSLKLARELADPPAAFTVTTVTPKARRDMRRLEKALILDRSSTSAAHIDSQILLKFIAYQNKQFDAKLPPPRMSALFTLPSNPFFSAPPSFGDVTRARQHIQKWREFERSWIKESESKPSLALIIFSAILHGGLLHKNCISAFARALLEPTDKIGYAGHQITVALELAWNGLPRMEFRSWQPDILTACAIIPPEQLSNLSSQSVDDLRACSNEQLCRTIFRQIVDRMKILKVSKEVRPRNLKHLIDLIALGARTEVPGILVDYATRQIVSHSVRPDVLRRIYAQPGPLDNRQTNLPGETDPGSNDRGQETTIRLSSSEGENPDDQEPIGLKLLRNALNAKTIEEALKQLHSLLYGIEKPERRKTAWNLITDFAEYLLSRRQVVRPGVFSKRNLALSTVRAYAVNLVGRRFGRLLEGKGPLDLKAARFEDYYTQTIENSLGVEATNRQKRALISALREFHDFLVQEHGASPIRDPDLFGVVRGLLPVDATIITLDEYNKARRLIRSDNGRVPDLRERQMAEALLIIGFKCGARRMEALNLQISDLLIKGEPWLLIRPWDHHALKTINAKRQIPLRSFLDRSEFKVLRRCLNEAKTLSKDNKYLFGISDNNQRCRVIPEDRIMPIVHRALREATNDSRIRFHHCRHSFATWTLLRLMLSDLKAIPDLFPHLSETRAWLQGSKRFRRAFYSGDSNQTRRHARAVASLLGHSGPLTSLEHYIHSLSWLLPHFLASSKLLGNTDARDVAILAHRAASGVYSATADPKKRLKKKKAHAKQQSKSLKVPQQRRFSFPVRVFRARFPGSAPSYETNVYQATKQDDSGAPSILDLWSVLFLRQTTREPIHSIAERFGIEPEEADAVIHRVQTLHRIVAPRGKKTKRHKKLFQLPEKNTKNSKPGLLYPKRSLSKRSEAFIRTFEVPLMACAQKHPSLVRSVLTYYVHNIWSSENVLVFRDPAEPQSAIEYLTFLKELEFGRPGNAPILFITFDKGQDLGTRNYWQEALGMTDSEWASVEKRDPVFESCEANRKWLSIAPRLGAKEEDAYRFLMIMAAIAFGFSKPAERSN